MNKSQTAQLYKLEMRGLDSATAVWTKSSELGVSREVGAGEIGAGEIGEFSITVSLPETANYKRSQTIELIFSETVGDNVDTIIEPARFWGPNDAAR